MDAYIAAEPASLTEIASVQTPPDPIEIDKHPPTVDNPTSGFGLYGSDGEGNFVIVVHNNGSTPILSSITSEATAR